MASSLAATSCGLSGTTVVTSFQPSSSTGGSRFNRRERVAVARGRARIQAQVVSDGEGGEQGSNDEEVKKMSGKKEELKTSLFTSVTDALDFSEARSEKDVALLAEAREATQSGEQMSREQYGALRRKIGGTYKDFFKDSVDVIGDYVDDGWVDKTCRVCKKDTSNDSRTKDARGRYAHVECLQNEKSGNFFSRLFGK